MCHPSVVGVPGGEIVREHVVSDVVAVWILVVLPHHGRPAAIVIVPGRKLLLTREISCVAGAQLAARRLPRPAALRKTAATASVPINLPCITPPLRHLAVMKGYAARRLLIARRRSVDTWTGAARSGYR